jgi:hypothetical protein
MKPWFGPKTAGYGVGPKSWQGWAMTALFLVAILGVRHFFHPENFGLPVWSRAAAMVGLALGFLLVSAVTYGQDDEG